MDQYSAMVFKEANVDKISQKSSGEITQLIDKRKETASTTFIWVVIVLFFIVLLLGLKLGEPIHTILMLLLSFTFPYSIFHWLDFNGAATKLSEELQNRIYHLENGGDKYWDLEDEDE